MVQLTLEKIAKYSCVVIILLIACCIDRDLFAVILVIALTVTSGNKVSLPCSKNIFERPVS